MSNIKLVHSGGNRVSLTTPTSNPSSNVTFKLPAADGSAGQVLTTDGNGNLSWITIAPGGITVAQQFRKTADQNIGNTQTVLETNWEKVDNGSYGSLGTFADPSSGVFTFPSTGVYLVRFNGYWEDTNATNLSQQRILVTTNASSGNTYSAVAEVNTSNSDNGTYDYCSGTVEYLLDVTSTADVKVKFDGRCANTASLVGSSTQNRTYVTFLRLGDT